MASCNASTAWLTMSPFSSSVSFGRLSVLASSSFLRLLLLDFCTRVPYGARFIAICKHVQLAPFGVPTVQRTPWTMGAAADATLAGSYCAHTAGNCSETTADHQERWSSSCMVCFRLPCSLSAGTAAPVPVAQPAKQTAHMAVVCTMARDG